MTPPKGSRGGKRGNSIVTLLASQESSSTTATTSKRQKDSSAMAMDVEAASATPPSKPPPPLLHRPNRPQSTAIPNSTLLHWPLRPTWLSSSLPNASTSCISTSSYNQPNPPPRLVRPPITRPLWQRSKPSKKWITRYHYSLMVKPMRLRSLSSKIPIVLERQSRVFQSIAKISTFIIRILACLFKFCWDLIKMLISF